MTHDVEIINTAIFGFFEQHVLDMKVGVVQHVETELAFVNRVSFLDLLQKAVLEHFQTGKKLVESVPIFGDFNERCESLNHQALRHRVIENGKIEVGEIQFLKTEILKHFNGADCRSNLFFREQKSCSVKICQTTNNSL